MTVAILLLVVAMLLSLVIVGIAQGISVYHMKKGLKSKRSSILTAHKGTQKDEVSSMNTTYACITVYIAPNSRGIIFL